MKKTYLVKFNLNMDASNFKQEEIRASKEKNAEKIIKEKYRNQFVNIISIKNI